MSDMCVIGRHWQCSFEGDGMSIERCAFMPALVKKVFMCVASSIHDTIYTIIVSSVMLVGGRWYDHCEMLLCPLEWQLIDNRAKELYYCKICSKGIFVCGKFDT